MKKQIVYTRPDSVKSSATTYSMNPQTGGFKVVRLIRGENGASDMFANETARTNAGMTSAIKGLASNGQMVRKI